MSVIFKCDGCGETVTNKRGVKPNDWFTREDDDGRQDACSRRCIDQIAKPTGKTGAVLPI